MQVSRLVWKIQRYLCVSVCLARYTSYLENKEGEWIKKTKNSRTAQFKGYTYNLSAAFSQFCYNNHALISRHDSPSEQRTKLEIKWEHKTRRSKLFLQNWVLRSTEKAKLQSRSKMLCLFIAFKFLIIIQCWNLMQVLYQCSAKFFKYRTLIYLHYACTL